MNDDSMREAAAERLLTAELVAVLAPSASAKAIAWWPRWAAAAVAVFGLVTVLGVAALRAREGTFAQQPAFDPLDPAFNEEWPVTPRAVPIADWTQLNAVPADADSIYLRPATQDLLAAAARRPGLKRLAAQPTRDGSTLSLDVLSVARELGTLSLGSPFPASELRELRHLPSLRRLAIVSPSLDFDEAAARAIAEAPFLRALVLGTNPPSAAGIRALSGLPDLEFLGIHTAGSNSNDPAWMNELPRLRSLKGLRLEGVTTPDNLAAILSQLPQLRVLQLGHVQANDSVLAAVPIWIERLQLGDLRGASASALLDLSRCRKLRSLGLRALRSGHDDTVCELVRRLPLEQFEDFVDAPSDELWKVLQEKASLRFLRIRMQGEDLAPHSQRAARCRALEVLELVTAEVPPVDSFRPLLAMPVLRRIHIHVHDRTPWQPKAAPELPELRAMFPGRLAVFVD